MSDSYGTVKDEAAPVVGEAKSQVKDLYTQSQHELKEQAAAQQQRIAVGLHAVSDELDSMASNSDQGGVASDLVRQVSGRLSGVATWLGDRDPSSVLTEVKRYARRKPGTFILGALFAGIVVGRLTRALAANTSADKADPAPLGVVGTPEPEPWDAPVPVAEIPVEETPIFAQSSPSFAGRSATEDGDVRPDTL